MSENVVEGTSSKNTVAAPQEEATSSLRRILRWIRVWSLLVASFYIFIVGRWNVPHGLQTSLLMILLLSALRISGSFERQASREETALYFLGLLNAIWPAVTSNEYMLELNRLVFFVVGSILLVCSTERRQFPMTASEWWRGSLRCTGHALINLFNRRLAAMFLPLTPKVNVRASSGITVLVSAGVLLVFHLLFAQVNAEYATFVQGWLERLLSVLEYIFNIHFLYDCSYTALLGFMIFNALCERMETEEREPYTPLRDTVATAVGASVLLFLVFIRFQGKLLFTPASSLSFHDLSLYVQKGFWELLVIAAFGYSLICFALQQRPLSAEQHSRWKQLLALFTAELLTICAFCAHKIGILQAYFGLKDQRIIASVAILLVTGTFLLILLRLFRNLSAQRIFAIQVYSLTSCVLLLSAVNVDWFLTRVRPTTYYVRGQAFLDYSYLLTNSFDNSSEWPSIIAEAEKTGIPLPENYYWGSYRSLCTPGRNNPLTRQWTAVRERYSDMENRPTLRQLSQFNFNEWHASQILKDHAEEFARFERFVTRSCQPVTAHSPVYPNSTLYRRTPLWGQCR
jgi:hypothetical protein